MTFPEQIPWIWLAVAFALLAPLSWFAWNHSNMASRRVRVLGLVFRTLGIAFILFALANPQRIRERPASGKNVVALLADNSAGMSTKDPQSTLSRGETLKGALDASTTEWIANLNDTYQIRNYRFGTSLQRISDFSTLDFADQNSRINFALRETQNRFSNSPLAAVLLFTDGVATDTELDETALADYPPIFPIVQGSNREIPDLAIRSVDVRQSAFGDSPVQLNSSLKLTRFDESEVVAKVERLPLLEDGSTTQMPQQIAQKSVSTDAEAKVNFEWIPQEGGLKFYRFTASRIADPNTSETEEAVLANNERTFVVDRGKQNYRLLYVTGRPNWEYKFLNRALSIDPQVNMVGLIRVASREPNFEFKGRAGENTNSLYRGFGREDENERYDEAVLIRMNTKDEHELRTGFPDTAESLFAYDAIIIDDLEADFFTFNQQTLIREFVKQRGGGLMILGGVNSLEDGGYRDTPISEALPVYIDGPSTLASTKRAAQWSLTREGWVEPWVRVRELDTDEKFRLQDMPLLKVYNTLERIKPGASTLATLTDATTQSYPALVTRNFGSGRVATLAVGDLWRWGMQDAGTQADLAQFWRQVSRWLVKDNLRQVELHAKSGEESGVTLNAIARDATFRPIQTGSAKVFIKQLSDGNESLKSPLDLELSMKAVQGKPGAYALELPINESGAYHAKVEIVGNDGSVLGEAETGWVNEPLVNEFASLSPNREYLERLAEATGGRVLELGEVGSIVSALQSIPAPNMETWTEPLWHSNWLFLIALACFLAEWLLRRKRGLA